MAAPKSQVKPVAQLSTSTGIGAGLVVLGAFVGWELKRVHPMLNPRIFRRPRLAAGIISIFVQFFAFFGFIFVVLQSLQIVRGDSPLVAAVSIFPLAGVLMPVLQSRSHGEFLFVSDE